MTAVPLVEMPEQVRVEYVVWLWALVRTDEPDVLLDYERRLGCLLRDIQARRCLARHAQSPTELQAFLSMLGLWLDREERPRRMGSGLKLTYNQGSSNG